ncbi:hypothetical protein A3K64_03205 [Candidatus Micrarchaeota archaeon RBG_16_36_9]|nr:MAG: hypothetical protein A3K64_03205 [Candidatus Micrarchaeota archaeon RBG_16_36_9]
MEENYKGKVIGILTSSRVPLKSIELSRMIGLTLSQTDTLVNHMLKDGEIDYISSSRLREMALLNHNMEITPKGVFFALKGRTEKAAVNKLMDIVRGNIRYEDRKIDIETRGLTGDTSYPKVDKVMKLLTEAGSEDVYKFLMDEVDKKMRHNIRNVEAMIDKREALKTKLDGIKARYKI